MVSLAGDNSEQEMIVEEDLDEQDTLEEIELVHQQGEVEQDEVLEETEQCSSDDEENSILENLSPVTVKSLVRSVTSKLPPKSPVRSLGVQQAVVNATEDKIVMECTHDSVNTSSNSVDSLLRSALLTTPAPISQTSNNSSLQETNNVDNSKQEWIQKWIAHQKEISSASKAPSYPASSSKMGVPKLNALRVAANNASASHLHSSMGKYTTDRSAASLSEKEHEEDDSSDDECSTFSLEQYTTPGGGRNSSYSSKQVNTRSVVNTTPTTESIVRAAETMLSLQQMSPNKYTNSSVLSGSSYHNGTMAESMMASFVSIGFVCVAA